jgi:thiamine biosynthesis lipoprotein
MSVSASASVNASASASASASKRPQGDSHTSTDTHTHTLKRARPLLGTIVEIFVDAESESIGHEAIDRAFDAIEVIQQRMSFHDPRSVVSLLNAEADKHRVSVDEKTFRVLEIAQELNEASGGVFDIAIAPELEETGFLPKIDVTSRVRVSFATPSAFGVASTPIELCSDRSVRFWRPNLRIDLGGIAKGFAVDEAVATLQEFGISSGSVNAGGDLQVFGERQFTVEVRDPDAPGKMFAAFQVRDQAISTSAHYFADRISSTNSIGAFVDPRIHSLAALALSVTVVAPSAVFADALTKVVMINPTDCLSVLRKYDAAALMVDHNGAIFCTPNWHAKVDNAA